MNELFLNAKQIYAITDYDNLGHEQVLNQTKELFRAGINILQYRNKCSSVIESIQYAHSLKQLCSEFNAVFIINDDISLATQLEADGLHIGKDDINISEARKELPDKIIGVSCYNDLITARQAEQQSANYLAFGSFFPSQSKPEAVTASIELLQRAKLECKLPIVAIGGITPENAKQLVTNGADYLAVISGLYQDSDPYSKALEYLKLYNNH